MRINAEETMHTIKANFAVIIEIHDTKECHHEVSDIVVGQLCILYCQFISSDEVIIICINCIEGKVYVCYCLIVLTVAWKKNGSAVRLNLSWKCS